VTQEEQPVLGARAADLCKQRGLPQSERAAAIGTLTYSPT
jgi:hypothetical protein